MAGICCRGGRLGGEAGRVRISLVGDCGGEGDDPPTGLE